MNDYYNHRNRDVLKGKKQKRLHLQLIAQIINT